MAGARRTAGQLLQVRSPGATACTRWRPVAGGPREAAAATQGGPPVGSGDAAVASGGGTRPREPLIADAAPDLLPGASRFALGTWRRPSRWRAEGVPLMTAKKVLTGRRHNAVAWRLGLEADPADPADPMAVSWSVAAVLVTAG